jgi:UDP-N-acetylmuramoyl-tripeptide--D-alanyl-D-alanine ligase
VRIPAFGVHMVYAALAGATVGWTLGMTDAEIAEGVSRYQTVGDRARVLKAEKYTVISDCYNANPSSCKSAIESFANLNAERKMIFMGAMKELGEVSETEHRKVFELMQAKDFERIVLVGKEYEKIADTKAEYFSTSEEMKEYLSKHKIEDATILIKGSRSTKMEVLKDVL